MRLAKAKPEKHKIKKLWEVIKKTRIFEKIIAVTVETEAQNTMENETQNVGKSEEVQPLDKQ